MLIVAEILNWQNRSLSILPFIWDLTFKISNYYRKWNIMLIVSVELYERFRFIFIICQLCFDCFTIKFDKFRMEGFRFHKYTNLNNIGNSHDQNIFPNFVEIHLQHRKYFLFFVFRHSFSLCLILFELPFLIFLTE